MSKARDFCFKGAHYPPAARYDLARKNRVAPITQDTADTVQFEADEIANSEIYLDVQLDVPEEMVATMPAWNPDLQDLEAPKLEPRRDPSVAKWALEHDIFSEDIGYDLIRLRVAMDGIGARAGCYVLDWDPAQGVRGQIFPCVKNPAGQTLWHSSYQHPNERGNPFLIIREFPQVEDARNRWPNVKDKLLADNQVPPEWRSAIDPMPGMPVSEGTITILRCYELYDSTKRWNLEHTHEPKKLPRQEQYLACPQCGWEGPKAGSLRLPQQQPCPECGAAAGRIETDGTMVPTEVFKKGKRYTVIAPNCLDAGELESGGWPGDPPIFPIFYFVPGVHPHEPSGLSKTEWNIDLQCGIDMAFRIATEEMTRNRNYLALLEGEWLDGAGEPWDPIMGDYTTYTRNPQMVAGGMHVHQGAGLPNGIVEFLQMSTERFRATRGIGQLGASPETLKGVQVGVAQRYLDTGDVPLDTKLKLFRLEETRAFKCWHHMQRNLWTKADWVGLVGPDGDREFRSMKGEDIPAARLKVTGRPTVNASDLENVKKLNEVLQQAQNLTPAAFEILLQASNLPQAWVAKLMKERKQQAAAQAGTQAGGAPTGPGMAPLPQPNGIAAPMVGAMQ